MVPESALWLTIGIAWVFALMPWFTELPFAYIPWRQAEEQGSAGMRSMRALLQWVVVIGAATVMAHTDELWVQVVAMVVILCAFVLPALTVAKQIPVKTFAARLVELLLMYCVAGGIGFAMERSLVNPAQLDWRFYAVSLCLFIVMAYPGFVIRHLLKNRYNRRLIAQTQTESL